jgi:hypothetical protein
MQTQGIMLAYRVNLSNLNALQEHINRLEENLPALMQASASMFFLMAL